jgi:hypothetical protein
MGRRHFDIPIYRRRRVGGTFLILSNNSVLEDAAIGDLVGILSVTGSGGPYTFTITSDPDSKFAIDGDRLEVNAPLDYATATSHSVTIEADDGVNPPISRTFIIQVLATGYFLLLANGTDKLLLVDGSSYLKLASSP